MGRKRGLPIYLPVFALREPVECGCNFFELIEGEDESGGKYYVGRCVVQARYLTKSQVAECIKYWSKCPLLTIKS